MPPIDNLVVETCLGNEQAARTLVAYMVAKGTKITRKNGETVDSESLSYAECVEVVRRVWTELGKQEAN